MIGRAGEGLPLPLLRAPLPQGPDHVQTFSSRRAGTYRRILMALHASVGGCSRPLCRLSPPKATVPTWAWEVGLFAGDTSVLNPNQRDLTII
jgi:hypothetical protein